MVISLVVYIHFPLQLSSIQTTGNSLTNFLERTIQSKRYRLLISIMTSAVCVVTVSR